MKINADSIFWTLLIFYTVVVWGFCAYGAYSFFFK
jgi:hypothetical protein